MPALKTFKNKSVLQQTKISQTLPKRRSMSVDERNNTMQNSTQTEHKAMLLVGLHGEQVVSMPTETAAAKARWLHRLLVVVWSPTSISNHGWYLRGILRSWNKSKEAREIGPRSSQLHSENDTVSSPARGNSNE